MYSVCIYNMQLYVCRYVCIFFLKTLKRAFDFVCLAGSDKASCCFALHCYIGHILVSKSFGGGCVLEKDCN